MENTTEIGLNRTGLQMAPMSKDDMIEFAKAKADCAPPEKGGMAALHRAYIEEADGVGSVPLPGSLKGAAVTGMEKLKGAKPEVLIDKLGERLAFERTGTRLYDALILKCASINLGTRSNGHAVKSPGGIENSSTGGAMVDVQVLKHIRDEEENHFQLVRHALTTLGADPTAMTPCADVVGVSSSGLLQTVSDPATNVPQCLNAVLTAELSDNAGWELLIELAGDAGHGEMASQFAQALEEEKEHVKIIKGWLRSAVLAEAM